MIFLARICFVASFVAEPDHEGAASMNSVTFVSTTSRFGTWENRMALRGMASIAGRDNAVCGCADHRCCISSLSQVRED